MLTDIKFNLLLPRQVRLLMQQNLVQGDFTEGHALFMIITEMAEVIDAERKKKYAPPSKEIDEYDTTLNYWDGYYEREIKNCFESEFADIYIRLLTYCYYKRIFIDTKNLIIPERVMIAKTLPEQFMALTGMLWKSYFHKDTDTEETFICQFFQSLEYIVLQRKIDIEKFILMKMDYNDSTQILKNKVY